MIPRQPLRAGDDPAGLVAPPAEHQPAGRIGQHHHAEEQDQAGTMPVANMVRQLSEKT